MSAVRQLWPLMFVFLPLSSANEAECVDDERKFSCVVFYIFVHVCIVSHTCILVMFVECDRVSYARCVLAPLLFKQLKRVDHPYFYSTIF